MYCLSIIVVCCPDDGDDYSLEFRNKIYSTGLAVYKTYLKVGRLIPLLHNLNLLNICNSITLRVISS